jgi:hypothetical protein
MIAQKLVRISDPPHGTAQEVELAAHSAHQAVWILEGKAPGFLESSVDAAIPASTTRGIIVLMCFDT